MTEGNRLYTVQIVSTIFFLVAVVVSFCVTDFFDCSHKSCEYNVSPMWFYLIKCTEINHQYARMCAQPEAVRRAPLVKQKLQLLHQMQILEQWTNMHIELQKSCGVEKRVHEKKQQQQQLSVNNKVHNGFSNILQQFLHIECVHLLLLFFRWCSASSSSSSSSVNAMWSLMPNFCCRVNILSGCFNYFQYIIVQAVSNALFLWVPLSLAPFGPTQMFTC